MSEDEESEYETTSEEEEAEETESGSDEEHHDQVGKDDAYKEPPKVPNPPAKTNTNQPPKNEKQEQKPTERKELVEPVTSQGATQGRKKMTHVRKQNLKSLMLNKAREDLKVEAANKAEEKKRILSNRIQTIGDLNSMDENELRELCCQLSAKIDMVDEQRYDVEAKVKKNDQEIDDLNQRIYDLRGKFKRPPLRRVRITADQLLRALLGSKHKASMDLRSNLKSVKKEEPKKEEANKDWRENVEAKQHMSGKKAMFEQVSQQESQEASKEEEDE